jgi:thiol-disulfide isomerase/thioredoxin
MKNRTVQTLLTIMTTALLTLTAGCGKKEPAPQPSEPAAQSIPGESVPAETVQPTESVPSETVQPAVPAEVPMPTAPDATAKMGDPAAKLDGLMWIKGQPISFQPGKVYVVEFWATWCGPCRVSIPHLTEVQKQFKDKGVTVVGITDERDAIDKVKRFVAEQGEKMDYTVAVDTGGNVNEAYMKAYGQNGIPAAFIVDGTGKVAWVGHPLDDIDTVLTQVAAGTFDAAAYAKARAEREALQREINALAEQYAQAVMNGKPAQSRPLADKFIEKADVQMLNEMAWWILTEVKEAKRDYPTALKAAEKANTLTEGKEANILDTYALALFKNGKTAEAVAAQTKAIELAADNKDMQDELQRRLDEFKAALPK